MTLRRGRAFLFASVLLLPACGTESPTPLPTPSSGPSGTCAAGVPVPGTPALTTVVVARGLSSPLDLQSAPGDRSRVFVVEQTGRIRVIRDGTLLSAPFLDVSDRISSGGERGLLGLAFHPNYAQNGRFFVNYTDRPGGHTHIAEFRGGPGTDSADPSSERLILFVTQPFSNHNGGGLTFGRDGMLYIGLGDGGSGGDPLRNGQSLLTYLGKMLRIDVDRGTPYAVPSDNPFAGRPPALPEIWAYGLRNPWRFAFDRTTGDLFIADVGQGEWEEIDVGLASRRGGENYGWNVTEGSHCFQPSSGCSMSGITLPVLEYDHSQGCSVTGGVVYRGCRLPGYQGTYFYSDYCSAIVRSFRLDSAGRATEPRDWTMALGRGLDRPTSFGVDADGEIYMVDQNGTIYRVVPAS
jgi:glucose/arabinose dehydrogenase